MTKFKEEQLSLFPNPNKFRRPASVVVRGNFDNLSKEKAKLVDREEGLRQLRELGDALNGKE